MSILPKREDKNQSLKIINLKVYLLNDFDRLEHKMI